MKTNKFFLSLATLMVCATSVFISCSNDDDDNNNRKELGDKAVTELKTRLIDEDGAVVFGELNEQGCYEIGIETLTDAQKLVGRYTKNYDGNAATYTYTLPDARGTVRVDKGDVAGVYYNVKFAGTGIPQMTLQVVEPNYMEDENKIKVLTSYYCNSCGNKFRLPNLAAKICPSCGGTDLVKQ